MDRYERDRERINNLEAIIWAHEHHNQVVYLSELSENTKDYRERLMEQYGFDYDQAAAITEMRSKAYTRQEREKVKAELIKLISVDK